ncbi:ABC transporter ATP-binding protein [Streptomyces sp. NPDC004227]
MLDVRGLTVRYGAVEALTDVSVSVGEGELVAILGSNGAGKSTLLRSISRLVECRSGEITFCDDRLDRRKAEAVARAGISHVPEGRRIFGSLTIEQNLMLGSTPRADRSGIEQDFRRVYEMFPILYERRKQHGWALSGGQQQMLAIGRGLMGRPKLLMLDEPSLGLAPLLVAQVLATVREICDGGTSVLLVEQNARAALKIADRGLVLVNGRVAQTGPADRLAGDPELRQAYLGA